MRFLNAQTDVLVSGGFSSQINLQNLFNGMYIVSMRYLFDFIYLSGISSSKYVYLTWISLRFPSMLIWNLDNYLKDFLNFMLFFTEVAN